MESERRNVASRTASRASAVASTTTSTSPAAVDRRASKYSGGVLVILFVIGVAGSMLDVTFLQDVLGRVLNMSTAMAYLIAAVIGLVASVAVMGLAGYRQGHDDRDKSLLRMPEFWIWLVIGLILAFVRVATASIIEIDSSESVMQLGPWTIRTSDFVTAPLMFVLYLGTGLLVNFCAREFFYTDMFREMQERNLAKKAERESRKKEALEAMDERRRQQRELAEATRREQLDRREKALAKRQAADERRKQREGYDQAVAEYKKIEQSVHARYQRIAEALTELEEARAELERTKEAYRRLLDNVDQSCLGTQNEVALLIHSKTPDVSVETLQGIIDQHNQRVKQAK